MVRLKAIPGSDENSAELKSRSTDRRKFISRLGYAAAASFAVSATGPSSVAEAAITQSNSTATPPPAIATARNKVSRIASTPRTSN